MLIKLTQWRKDRGLANTVNAVAAATAVARDVPGDGDKWEKLHGKSWDDDENNYYTDASQYNNDDGSISRKSSNSGHSTSSGSSTTLTQSVDVNLQTLC